MNVVIAASEAVPYEKTGGLADVAGTLTDELRGLGVNACLVMPLYGKIRRSGIPLDDTGNTVRVEIGGITHTARVYAHGKRAFFADCPEYFDRPDVYGTSTGEYADNAARFIFLSRAALEICLELGLHPDVIHSNDWQTALIPLYHKTFYRESLPKTRTLFTIHNLAYQGVFPPHAMSLTGFPPSYFNPSLMEYYGQVNFMKTGIISADAVSTVSPTYAGEVLTKEYGFGLEGVLASRHDEITGILNGIDVKDWNPETDAALIKNYGLSNPSGKKECRKALVKECGLDGKGPVIGAVGRLSAQKGIDILVAAAPEIIAAGASLAIIGKGDEKYGDALKGVSARNKGRVFFQRGFDERLARRIFAGADMILIPSRYEPCGLTQMIAMRYGAVPVARRTGGLADSIEDYVHPEDRGTGFLFGGYDASALSECIKRALGVYARPKEWANLSRAVMAKDFSWTAEAGKYVRLYERLSSGEEPA